MIGFINELRDKMNLKNQLLTMIFGHFHRTSIVEDPQAALGTDIQRVKNYNCLKKVVDNCAFDVGVGEDEILKEKHVELERLNAVLVEAKMTMKVQYFLSKKIKTGSISKADFLDGFQLFESEKGIFTSKNEHRMLKTLMQISMANPKRIELDADPDEDQNTVSPFFLIFRKK